MGWRIIELYLHGEFLQIAVIRHVSVNGRANDLCSFLTVLLLPLSIELFFSFGCFLLIGDGRVSVSCTGSKNSNTLGVRATQRDY